MVNDTVNTARKHRLPEFSVCSVITEENQVPRVGVHPTDLWDAWGFKKPVPGYQGLQKAGPRGNGSNDQSD